MNHDLFDSSNSAQLDSISERPVPRFSVSDFLAITNDTLEYAFSDIEIEGEISSFKISKNKWVFFDIKDETSVLQCFTLTFKLYTPLEDGMRIVVRGTPKLTKLGHFSFNLKSYRLIGEGTIKKAHELLKQKLAKEGLFDPERKRPLPAVLKTIGVISSIKSAGYTDFIKILNNRWGGLHLKVANVGVQGASAANEIIRALALFNESISVDAIVIIRGGGSAEDLSVFDNEQLVRAVAASRIPIISGIGHEIDVSLVDLAADIRASTPSNAAEIISKDRSAELTRLQDNLFSVEKYLKNLLDTTIQANRSQINNLQQKINDNLNNSLEKINSKITLIQSFNPETALKNGYAILRGNLSPGSSIQITTYQSLIEANITHVQPRKN